MPEPTYAVTLPSGRQMTAAIYEDGSLRVDFTKGGAIDGFFDIEKQDAAEFLDFMNALSNPNAPGGAENGDHHEVST